MHMLRNFAALLGLFCLLSFSAFSQENADFDLDSFRETAVRAEKSLETMSASSDVFEGLRSELSVHRSKILKAQEQRAARVATIRDQLDILGPKPTEGEQQEPLELASRRGELNGQLAEALAPLIVAQEAFRRSESLIGQIDSVIRERQSSELLSLGKTPLNPSLWSGALDEFGQYLKGFTSEFARAFDTPSSLASIKGKAPLLIGLILLGLFLIFPGYMAVSNRLNAVAKRGVVSAHAFSAFILSLGLVVAPFVGSMLIVQAFQQADIFMLRGTVLVSYAPYIVLSVVVGLWVARNLFHTFGPGAMLLKIEEFRLEGGRRTCIGLGLVFALYYFLRAATESDNFSEETQAVLFFPLVVMGSYGLYSVTRKVRNYRKSLETEDMTGGITLTVRIFRFVNLFCLSVSILAPIVAALGYVNMGVLLVFSTLLTVALITSLFLLFALLVGMIDWASSRGSTEEEGSNIGGLFKSGLAFVLICLGMPVLAIIWGARVSDISDIWLLMKEGVSVGDARLSFSDILAFFMVFTIGYTVTRLIQSALRTGVLPNTRIDEAAQNSLVTGFGYVGIFLSALVAITTTGLDLSNLAIVAGALSVGIGFGLQAIVSNFVSGIILLIERPIKLGDWIEVGGNSGYVRTISVRSTSIETFDRAMVIVPNADFISGTVTNRTLNNTRGRVIAPVGVSYDCDPVRVKEVLMEIVEAHPMVLKNPAPNVLFINFGASSLDFEIRAILRDVNFALSVRSDLNFEISKRFAEEGFEIPFAQQDVTIRNIDQLSKPAKPIAASKTKPK